MQNGAPRTLHMMLFCIWFGMTTPLPSYGEPTMNGRPPLAQEFGSKPGAYDLVIRVSQPIVDPGDRLQIEVFISGYGVIGAAKVAYYPSPEVIDYGRSKLTWGLEKYDDGGSGWGGSPKSLADPSYSAGATLTFRDGANEPGNPQWQRGTWFFDPNRNQVGDYQISTEVKNPRGTSPIYLDLVIARNVKRGPHSIQFALTYFDGQTWKTASKNADFTVRNVYQRYEWWIARVGLVAAVATIGPMLRWPWLLWRRLRPTSALATPPTDRRATVSKDRKRSRGK